VNDDQLHDAAEREMDLYRAEITRVTAERDRLARQLLDAGNDNDQLTADLTGTRTVLTEILDAFGPSGSGHTARVGMVQIAKWRTRAGLTS
jgi:acetolactate synthase small subunit